MTLLIKNVKYLVTCDDDNRVLKEVNVFVEDGIIKSIGADVQTADDVIVSYGDVSGVDQYPPSLISDIQSKLTRSSEHGIIPMA